MIALAQAQLFIAAVFIISLAGHLLSMIISYSTGRIYADTLLTLSLIILGIYSGPLGIIVGGYFGQRSSRPKRISQGAFWLALTVAVIWNLLLLWRSVLFSVAERDFVEDLSSYLSEVAVTSMFLVAGALTYFFSRKN